MPWSKQLFRSFELLVGIESSAAEMTPQIFHMSHCYKALVKFLHLRNRSIERSKSQDKGQDLSARVTHSNGMKSDVFT